MNLIKFLYEILTARKYTHIDKDIGVLRRVGGYWRVESPITTLGVAVKIFGSDRFGPNSRTLENYKIYRDKFEFVWGNAIEAISQSLAEENLSWYNEEAEFLPLEIIFGNPNDECCDMAIAFSITTVDNNEFFANFNKGQYKTFGAMYCYHDS